MAPTSVVSFEVPQDISAKIAEDRRVASNRLANHYGMQKVGEMAFRDPSDLDRQAEEAAMSVKMALLAGSPEVCLDIRNEYLAKEIRKQLSAEQNAKVKINNGSF